MQTVAPIDYSTRSPMSYRPVLRSLPRALRRQWLTRRLAVKCPRVAIGRAWVPATVQRNLARGGVT